MTYEFTSKVRPLDFWLLSMYNTYHSLVGVVNIVFAVAMIALAYRFWNNVGYGVQTVLFLLCLVIPVIHPFGIYLKAKTQVALTPKDGTKLTFSDEGIKAEVGRERQIIRWKKVVAATKRCGMIIIYTDGAHGYILTNQILGRKKKEFYEFVRAHMDNQ